MQCEGFSLIEVMVSLLLLSMSLLGLDAMQFYALQRAQHVYYYHQAMNQLMNMTERLAVLKNDEAIVDEVPHWNEENNQVLPNGRGEVQGSFPRYTLIIFWGKSAMNCAENKIGATGCLRENIQVA